MFDIGPAPAADTVTGRMRPCPRAAPPNKKAPARLGLAGAELYRASSIPRRPNASMYIGAFHQNTTPRQLSAVGLADSEFLTI